MDSIRLDRAAGTLLGLASGDALGAGYEGKTPGPPDPQMIGGGYGPWKPGEWTDDTQMALCIAEEAASGAIDPVVVGDRFLAWLRGGASDVGIQTRAVLNGARSGGELADRAKAHFASHPRGAAGNGSLMRTAPVALVHLGDDRGLSQAASAISLLTHGDPLAGEACVLWCIGIDRAIREGRLDGIRDGLTFLDDPPRRAQWAEWLDEAEAKPPATFTGNGFVVRALQAAYASVVQTPIPEEEPGRHLREALRAAVSIGDDTDTVAAIAGGLLGARWGASAIPVAWLAAIKGWPGYTARDLTRLAVLAARGGKPDTAGWPGTTSMAPYYAIHPGRLGTTAIPLPDDEGVVIGDFGGLSVAKAQADVVVSLCRMGTEDVPGDALRVEPWLIDQEGQNPNLDLLLHDLADQICNWRDEGKRVYLHCVRAESRTPTVAAAYIAERYSLSGSQGLKRVYDIMPEARPSSEFRDALERVWT